MTHPAQPASVSTTTAVTGDDICATHLAPLRTVTGIADSPFLQCPLCQTAFMAALDKLEAADALNR